MFEFLPFVPDPPIPITDAHVHVYDDANAEVVLESALRFGARRLFASCLGPPPLPFSPSVEESARFNQITSRVVRRFPQYYVGYCYINPCHTGTALTELRRGVEDGGLRGLKLWMACYCDDPRVYPIVEQAIAYRLPILIHTWTIVGGSKPNESEADHVARLASRYPEAKIIMAHLSGDWQTKLQIVQDRPNVHVDPSGIDPEDGQIEFAVERLGASRVIFGSDIPIRDLGSQIAKIYGANIDPAARRLILDENIDRLVRETAQ